MLKTNFLDIDRIEKDELEVMNDISYEDFDEDGIAGLSTVEINDDEMNFVAYEDGNFNNNFATLYWYKEELNIKEN